MSSATGTYRWVATYGGDANNTTVSSGCQDEPVTIANSTPTVVTTPSAGGAVGTTISDTATVSGGFHPTGTVTFRLFAPGDTTCTGNPLFTSTATLSGGSAGSGSFMTATVGTHHWVATYNGDANNASTSTGCTDEPVIIGRATPTIVTTPSPGGVVGGFVFDTATVSGGFNPSGSVTFTLFGPGDTTCTGTPVFTTTGTLTGGAAGSGPFTTTHPGAYRWIASYGGDAKNVPVSSGCTDEPVTVALATPEIVTTPSAGGPAGTAISDTATVSGGFHPTGTVTFRLFPPSDTTCAGNPVFTSTNPLSAGSATSDSFSVHAVGILRWVAIYSGDSNNTTVSSGCQDEPVSESQATPTIATFPSAGGPVGSEIFDDATVSGGDNPTGTITFKLFGPGDATCSGTPVFVSTVSLVTRSTGSAAFTTTAVGTFHWVATYNGDADNASVASGCTEEPVTVGRASSAVITTVPSAGGVVGTAISDLATVSGGHSPTGSVTFELFPPTDLTCAGTAVFTSTNPLSGASAVSSSFTTDAVGTWNWVATYNGDVNNTATSTKCTEEQVDTSQATPTIATLQSTGGVVGTAISDTATVSGGFSPTGSVTFELFAPGDTTCTGTPVFVATNPLSGGSAGSGSFVSSATGTYRWVATYGGDANNTTVSSGCQDEPVTIANSTPTVVTTPSAGGAVGTTISDTATVSGGFHPTGTVTFRLFAPGDTTCTGNPLFTSTATLSGGSAGSGSFMTATVGTHHWVATYNGDANNASTSTGCTDEPVIIGRATPTIVTTPSPGGVVGTGISDTARVSGGVGPTGSVTFVLFAPGDTTCTGTPVFTSTNPLSAGKATSDTFTTDTVGTFRWVATYNGDANNNTVSSGCQDEPVSDTQAAPKIETFPSAGGVVGTDIFDTATVTGGHNPTGTVTFKLFAPGDTTCTGTPVFLQTVPLVARSIGSGSFTTTIAGTHRWIATYNGDANNASVASGCMDEEVVIGQATSAVITTVPSAGGVVGTSLSDTATVSGGFSPTGNVTFNLYAPGDTTCAGPAVFSSTNLLSGRMATSGSFATNVVGTWNWIATYNGDTNNAATSTKCTEEQVDTTQATLTIATTPSAGGVVGTSISDRATLSGGVGPTGTVTFELFAPGDTTCTGTPVFIATSPLSGGSAASGSFTTTAAGTHRWVAVYSGDANNSSVGSGCEDEPVTLTQATPAIDTKPAPGGGVGTSISDTATVSGGFNPSGTVTFKLFGPGDTTCTGTPVFTSTHTLGSLTVASGSFTTTQVGAYRWVATYNGDANNEPISSGCSDEMVDISNASPTMVTTPSAGGPVGTAISDHARVNAGMDPTGTVSFALYGPGDTDCTTDLVAGSRAFKDIPLTASTAVSPGFTATTPGTYQWVVTYSGDSRNNPAAAKCNDPTEQVVITAATATVPGLPNTGYGGGTRERRHR